MKTRVSPWPEMFRNRRLAALMTGMLLVFFVAVQCFGVIHNAEHGFHQHSHHGHECPIYDFCEHQNLGTGLPELPLVFLPAVPFPQVAVEAGSLTAIQPVGAAPARGPPALS